MRRLIPLLLAILGACHAPSVQIEPYHPPAWIMPETIAVIAQLDAACPLGHPVKVKVAPVNNRWGESWFDEKDQCFHITLNSQAEGQDGYCNTILHEWAHCMTQCPCEDPHCDHWGANFARCYRAIIDPGTVAAAQPTVEEPCEED